MRATSIQFAYSSTRLGAIYPGHPLNLGWMERAKYLRMTACLSYPLESLPRVCPSRRPTRHMRKWIFIGTGRKEVVVWNKIAVVDPVSGTRGRSSWGGRLLPLAKSGENRIAQCLNLASHFASSKTLIFNKGFACINVHWNRSSSMYWVIASSKRSITRKVEV